MSEKEFSICILNCYPNTTRDEFDRTDVGHPHDFYRDFLSRHCPEAHVDVIFIADAQGGLPEGATLNSYDGYIWTGSDLTIYHSDDPRVSRQIEFARAVCEAGVPCFGSCWGIQLAAVLAGGKVQKNPKGREWGIARRIRRTEEGRRSNLLAGKPECYDGFIMHLDEVTRLPKGATLLATNPHTRVQALEVRYGKGVFWATQYHPEYNLERMAKLIWARAEALVQEGFFGNVTEVQAHVRKMRLLHQNPKAQGLREELGVDEDLLDPKIRERELRNWVDGLVVPSGHQEAGRRLAT